MELYVRNRRASAPSTQDSLRVQAFIEFDLSALSDDEILSATLHLHEFDKLNAPRTADLFLAQVATDWDPSGPVPVYDQPIVGGTEQNIGANGMAGEGPLVDIDFNVDVTSIVEAWQADPSSNFGFRLRIAEEFTGAAFDHEGAMAPTLTVEQVSPAPAPATLLLVALGAGLLAVSRRRGALAAAT